MLRVQPAPQGHKELKESTGATGVQGSQGATGAIWSTRQLKATRVQQALKAFEVPLAQLAQQALKAAKVSPVHLARKATKVPLAQPAHKATKVPLGQLARKAAKAPPVMPARWATRAPPGATGNQGATGATGAAGSTYTGTAPVNVDNVANTIGLNPATNANDLMSWDGNNWVSKPLANIRPARTVNNMQPYLAVNYIINLFGIYPARAGQDAYMGEIELFAGNYAPQKLGLLQRAVAVDCTGYQVICLLF